MARIRRWKEKLLVAWFTLFTSFVWARPRSRTPEGARDAARTLLLTGSRGKRAWGVGLSTSKPYVRTLIASAMPVALPASVGAFALSAGAMADLPVDADAAAANGASSCSGGGGGGVCITSTALPCAQAPATLTCCKPCATADGQCASCRSLEFCSANFESGMPYVCKTCGAGTCGVYAITCS